MTGRGWRAGCGLGEPGRRRAPVGGGVGGSLGAGGRRVEARRPRRPSNGDAGAGARRGEPTLNAGAGAGPHTPYPRALPEGLARQRPTRDQDQLAGLRQLPPGASTWASSHVCASEARGEGGWVAGQASGPAVTAYFARAGSTSCDLMAYPSQWDGLSITPTNLQLDS